MGAVGMMGYWFVLVVLGLFVAGLDIILLAGFATPHWIFDALLWFAAGFISLWWFSRAVLVWVHNQRQQMSPGIEFPATGEGEIVPLPIQDDVIAHLKNSLMPAGEMDGRLVSFKGVWGAGKTVTLRRLQKDLALGKDFVPVWINVWRSETETELHRVFYEEVLHTPSVFSECWLALPWLTPRFSLLLRSAVHSVRLAFRNGGAEAEVIVQPDALLSLPVQGQIEWIADRLRQRGRGLVVILEELDRAAPGVTKQAIVSTERSFKLPGVTVILPYVQMHLWTKAFDPLDPSPPDLDSTMETLLQQDLLSTAYETAFSESENEMGGEPPAPEHLGLYAAKPIPQAQEANSPRPLDPKAPLAVWGRYRLHRRFALLDEQHRNRLRRRFSEKYLGGFQVEMGAYKAADIAALVTMKSSLFRMAQRVFPILDDESKAKELIRDAILRYHKDLQVRRLRHFESFYLRLLQKDLSWLETEMSQPPAMQQIQKLLTALGLSMDAPEARSLLERLPQTDTDWRLRYVARALAGIVALAAWYATMMHMSPEDD